jgi:replicative DNA helicase
METARKTTAIPSEVRVPPQNLEAEQSVLGAMMQSGEAVSRVIDLLTDDDFYREVHRKVFRAILDLYDRQEPVDTVTLTNELRRTGSLDLVGGVTALTDMVMSVPTPGNAEYYANIVREKAAARRLISAATQIVGDAYGEAKPIDQLLDEAEHLIFKATERSEARDFKPVKDLIGKSYEYVNDLAQNKIHITGVPTGFYDLDDLTAGLQRSELIVLGARPSVGKTSLALNIAAHVAKESASNPQPIAVGVFSLEMAAQQLTLRLLCSAARVNLQEVRSGHLSDAQKGHLLNAASQIHKMKLFIDDTSAMTVGVLKNKARRLKAQHDIGLLVVDYLQLIQGGERHDTREQEISHISRQLKALAKELEIPVLVLSQLSRPIKGAEDKKPVLSDLRESGAIEQDADVVLFIHREFTKEEPKSFKYELVLAKQRNGPIGSIPVAFRREYTTFESLARDEEE